MKLKNLTNIRILLSVILFFGGILAIPFLDSFSHNQVITAAFVYNLVGFIVIFINYNLLSLHLSRFKTQKDKLIYLSLGLVLFIILLAGNYFLLMASFPTIDYGIVSRFFYFVPLIIIIFSFIYACTYSLVYKLLTDRISIHHKEMKVILISSFIFSFIFSLCTGYAYGTYLQQFIYNFLATLIISYLYNQTGNLITGMLTFGIALLGYNCLFLFL